MYYTYALDFWIWVKKKTSPYRTNISMAPYIYTRYSIFKWRYEPNLTPMVNNGILNSDWMENAKHFVFRLV